MKESGHAMVLTTRTLLRKSKDHWRSLSSDGRKRSWLNVRRAVARYDWEDWGKMHGDMLNVFCTDLAIMATYKSLYCDMPICVFSYIEPSEVQFLKSCLDHNLLLNPEAGPKVMSKVLSEMGVKSSTRQALGCIVCGKVNGQLQKCGACKCASYCSTTCQKKDWRSHKMICGKSNMIDDSSCMEESSDDAAIVVVNI